MDDYASEFENNELTVESEKNLFDQGDNSISKNNEIADGLDSLFEDETDTDELSDEIESGGDSEIDRSSLFVKDDDAADNSEIADALDSLFEDETDTDELSDETESGGDSEIDRSSLFVKDGGTTENSEIADALDLLSEDEVDTDEQLVETESGGDNEVADSSDTLFSENVDSSIASLRQQAVRRAWERERELVLDGKGTRDWTVAQQQELLSTGKISGFEGQHIRNVAKYPEQAGNPENIQYLHYLEHLYGAHQGNFRNDTEGYYNTITGEITPVDSSFSVPVIDLTDRYDQEQAEYLSSLGREFGYGRKEDYEVSKEKHKTEKSSYNFWKGKPDYNREDDNNKV